MHTLNKRLRLQGLDDELDARQLIDLVEYCELLLRNVLQLLVFEHEFLSFYRPAIVEHILYLPEVAFLNFDLLHLGVVHFNDGAHSLLLQLRFVDQKGYIREEENEGDYRAHVGQNLANLRKFY